MWKSLLLSDKIVLVTGVFIAISSQIKLGAIIKVIAKVNYPNYFWYIKEKIYVKIKIRNALVMRLAHLIFNGYISGVGINVNIFVKIRL